MGLTMVCDGDFNEIMCNLEKVGGPTHFLLAILNFSLALDDCNPVDLGYR